jgi:hypothetical protein
MTDRNPAAAESLTDLSGLVYGVHVQGSLPTGFERYLRPKGEPAVAGEAAIEASYRAIRRLPKVDRIWLAEPTARASERLALFRQSIGFGLTVSCDGSGLFRIAPGAIGIEWLPGGAGPAHYFFSYALPLWLESRRVPVLHASAVSFENRVVAFVGQSGIGKSTLCAELVRSGCYFVTDDGLPLREDERGNWHCAPGPPLIRLWPSALERRLGISAGELPKVRSSLDKRMMPCAPTYDSDTTAGLELAAVYLLEGQPEGDMEVSICACTARESLVHLIEHSLAAAPAAALGLSTRRFGQLSRIAEWTPVRRLRYPSGADGSERIREAIGEDISHIAAARSRRD